MRVIVQRSKYAKVDIDGKIFNEIDHGLVLLVGFTQNDTVKEIEYCINKIVNLRIFDDEAGVMNKSIKETNGEILSISQFTLYGDIKKGNRPSYIKALSGAESTILYDTFNELLNEQVGTKTGIFGSEMLVTINNDGPVTIIIDTNN